MAETTLIQWADATFNPWIGCTRVSPACDHCYAETLAKRHGWAKWGAGEARKRTSEAYWKQPLAWDRKAAKAGKPIRVFCASLSDVFDAEVPDQWRNGLFHLIDRTPHLIWMLLTKRPKVALDYLGKSVPRPNVWMGVTVENQPMADLRIPLLLQIPAAKRFISAEPLLEPIDLTRWTRIAWQCSSCRRFYAGRHQDSCPDCGTLGGWTGSHAFNPPGGQIGSGLDWVIVGFESGPRARPGRAADIRSVVKQCKTAGVPCFVKQMGRRVIDRNDAGFDGEGPTEWNVDPADIEDDIHGYREEYQGADVLITLRDRKGGDPAEWPEDLRVREVPK